MDLGEARRRSSERRQVTAITNRIIASIFLGALVANAGLYCIGSSSLITSLDRQVGTLGALLMVYLSQKGFFK